MCNWKEYLVYRSWLDEHALSTISPVLVQSTNFNETEIALLKKNNNLIVETDSPQVVLECFESGIVSKNIFFRTVGNLSNYIAKLQGKCRFLLSSKEEIQLIDTLVEPYLQTGYLETVAIDLKIGNSAQNIFSDSNIEEFSRWIKLSRCLAVRSIFVSWEQVDDWSAAVRNAFSLIKKIRSDIPCLFTSFCLEGVAEPLMAEEKNLLKTMQTLAALNDTSLYANFCIK